MANYKFIEIIGSQTVSGIGYKNGALIVGYKKGGGLWEYYNVSEEKYLLLFESDDFTGDLNNLIRNKDARIMDESEL